MKRPVFAFTVLIGIASCAPVTLYHKTNGTEARLKSDRLACEVAGLEQAPVANQIRQAPPLYIPARRYCHADGRCYHRGGFFAPGEIYTTDVNARLRGDLLDQCMASKGYQKVELPRCAGSAVQPQATSSTSTTTDRLPPISESSCVIRDTSGNWLLRTP